MNREDIIRMALEAGIPVGITGGNPSAVQIERFAALVAAAAIKDAPDYKMGYADGAAVEREACAKVCEAEWSNVAERMYGEECAAAIRARGQA